MSKVVTIPKDRNPFVVIVNGVKYSYPAGVSTEVPDEVADVIEKYVGAKPKPDPNAGGGSGGGTQSDWNQTDSSAADFIKNKPFGDMPTGGDTLYWDGNTEGLVCFLDVYYKVSDATPSMGDFANGFVLNGAQQVPEFLTALGDGAFIHADGLFVVVPEDNMEINGEVIPSKGVYFLSNPGGGAVVSSLTIPDYTGFPVTKKMEEKYLPGAVILYADAENYLYATSDTSDTSKRMTKAELLAASQSGMNMWCYIPGEEGTVVYYQAYAIGFQTDFGMVMNDAGMWCTAEYAPET